MLFSEFLTTALTLFVGCVVCFSVLALGVAAALFIGANISYYWNHWLGVVVAVVLGASWVITLVAISLKLDI